MQRFQPAEEAGPPLFGEGVQKVRRDMVEVLFPLQKAFAAVLCEADRHRAAVLRVVVAAEHVLADQRIDHLRGGGRSDIERFREDLEGDAFRKLPVEDIDDLDHPQLVEGEIEKGLIDQPGIDVPHPVRHFEQSPPHSGRIFTFHIQFPRRKVRFSIT